MSVSQKDCKLPEVRGMPSELHSVGPGSDAVGGSGTARYCLFQVSIAMKDLINGFQKEKGAGKHSD